MAQKIPRNGTRRTNQFPRTSSNYVQLLVEDRIEKFYSILRVHKFTTNTTRKKMYLLPLLVRSNISNKKKKKKSSFPVINKIDNC